MDEPGPSITDSRDIIKQQKARGAMTCVLIFEANWCHLYSRLSFLFSPHINAGSIYSIYVTRFFEGQEI